MDKNIFDKLKDKLKGSDKEHSEESYSGDVNFEANSSNGKVKKILKPIAFVLGAVVVIVFFMNIVFYSPKNKDINNDAVISVEGTEQEDQEGDIKYSQEVSNIKSKNIISYSTNGQVKLLDKNEKELDVIDLNTLSADSKDVVKNTNHDIQTENKSDVKNSLGRSKEEIKEDLVLASTKLTLAISEEKDSSEIEEIKKEIDMLYEELETSSLEAVPMIESNMSSPEVYESDEELSIEEYQGQKSKDNDLADNKVQVTNNLDSFTNYNLYVYKIGNTENGLIFKGSNNSLYLVEAKKDKLNAQVIVTNDSVESIESAYIRDNYIYGRTNEEKILVIDINNNSLREVAAKELVSNLVALDNSIVYSGDETIYLLDLKNSNTSELVVGDKTEDIFIYDDHIYIINDFGKGNDNSILMKISIEEKDGKKELVPEEIIELKGKRSKFVDINNDSLFIEQMDSLKEINLKDFKADKSYKKQEFKSNAFINGDYMYEVTKDKVLKFNIETGKNETTNLTPGMNVELINK